MLKKFFIIILASILLTSCSNKKEIKKDVNTIIEKNNNILIGINYPITNIKKLDSIIKKDVEYEYNTFKKKYDSFNKLPLKSELNIDYVIDMISDKYISITLYIFTNSSNLKKPLNKVYTYNYDINDNKLIYLSDLFNDNELKKLIGKTKNKLIKEYSDCIKLNEINNIENKINLFTFDEDSIDLYFNTNEIAYDYCEIININIPIKKFKNKTKMVSINHSYPVNNIIYPNKKVVALTFDDGPSKYTDEILDILNDEDAVATFFIIGNKVEIFGKTLNKMIKYGNEIGNHSYNHKWLTRVSDEEFKNQINKTQNIIYNTTGFKPTLFRPTYGSINNKIRNEIDLDIIMWTVDTMDWKYKNVNTIVKRATNNIKDGDIILMHDIKKRTVNALKIIIPKLKEKGYQFVTVSELKEINKIRENNE